MKFFFLLLLWLMFALLDPDPDSESGSIDMIESGSETLEKRLGTYLTSGRCKMPLAGTPLSGPLPGGSTPPRGTPWRKGAPLMLTGAPRPGITPGRTMPAMRGRVFVIIIRPRKFPRIAKTTKYCTIFVVLNIVKNLLFRNHRIPIPHRNAL